MLELALAAIAVVVSFFAGALFGVKHATTVDSAQAMLAKITAHKAS